MAGEKQFPPQSGSLLCRVSPATFLRRVVVSGSRRDNGAAPGHRSWQCSGPVSEFCRSRREDFRSLPSQLKLIEMADQQNDNPQRPKSLKALTGTLRCLENGSFLCIINWEFGFSFVRVCVRAAPEQSLRSSHNANPQFCHHCWHWMECGTAYSADCDLRHIKAPPTWLLHCPKALRVLQG